MQVHFDPPLSPSSFFRQRRRLLAGLGVVFSLLALAAFFANGQLLLLWDEPIQKGIESNRTGMLTDFFLAVSFLGSTIAVLTLGAIATAMTWRRCQAVAVAIAVATLARPLLEFTLKATVGRSRPDFDRLVNGTGPSFPSGHVMAAVALWGLLPMIVALYTRRRWLWWASVAVAFTVIVGVSASRVYLGVHWFSDVSAGLVAGSFFLLAVETVFHNAHSRYGCRLADDAGHVHERAEVQPALVPERVQSR